MIVILSRASKEMLSLALFSPDCSWREKGKERAVLKRLNWIKVGPDLEDLNVRL